MSQSTLARKLDTSGGAKKTTTHDAHAEKSKMRRKVCSEKDVRCLVDLGVSLSRGRALAFISLGSLAGGLLIDVDHPIQAAIQGKSIFDMAEWLFPHGRFLHIPILILSFTLLVCSASFLAGWMLGKSIHLHIRGRYIE